MQGTEDIKMARLMPLVGQLKCFVRQQTSAAYTSLGYAISPEAADALMIIQHFDGLPQKQLADILGKDKASITRLLNTLVACNLVERIQDQEDRRVIRAHITQEGAQVFQQILPKLHALSDEAVQHISDHDFDHMIQVMTQIVDNISPSCQKNI